MREIIKKLAHKHGLDEDWMNDAAKGAISHIKDANPTVVYDGPYFSVSTPSPQYLLATKILASRRGRDYEDIKLLIQLCGFTTIDECLDVVEKYFPNRPVVARSQFAVEEILGKMGLDSSTD